LIAFHSLSLLHIGLTPITRILLKIILIPIVQDPQWQITKHEDSMLCFEKIGQHTSWSTDEKGIIQKRDGVFIF